MNALTTSSSSLCGFADFIGFLLPFSFLLLDVKVCVCISLPGLGPSIEILY